MAEVRIFHVEFYFMALVYKLQEVNKWNLM
jgi:hypothetical protein